MQERGYKALLVVVGIAVLIVLYFAFNDRGSISTLLGRADTSLQYKSYPQTDSSKTKPMFAKKSQRTLFIELNSADSATLCRVYGIGAAFSKRIIKHRQSLGGYYEVEQLREVYGIDKEVYERIAKNFFIDSARIQKININFATREMLTSHPYIGASIARRIEKARMKGGYINNRKELIDKNILLPKEALRVAPYFSFDSIKQH